MNTVNATNTPTFVPWINWSVETRKGNHERGQMYISDVKTQMDRARRYASELLHESKADHVLYGITEYADDSVTMKRIHFYMLDLMDEQFYRLTRHMKNVMVYALHKH